MRNSKQTRLQAGSLSLAATLTILVGCDGSGSGGTPPPPTPVANPSADNKLKDVTLENESANMDRIKKAGEGK
jgi:hypothetical protein